MVLLRVRLSFRPSNITLTHYALIRHRDTYGYCNHFNARFRHTPYERHGTHDKQSVFV
jgi:hypothetical protein